MIEHRDEEEWAEKALARVVPVGWKRSFVPPPWEGKPSACRACERTGGGGEWATVMVIRKLPEERTVLFTVAMCCKSCARTPEMVRKLGVDVFGPTDPLYPS